MCATTMMWSYVWIDCSAVRSYCVVFIVLCVEAVMDWTSLIRPAADLNPDLSNTEKLIRISNFGFEY